MWDFVDSFAFLFIWAFLDFLFNCAASIHVVLWKRNSRAAVSWIGLIWLVPFLGVLLYLLLGINRIQRKAQRLRPPMPSVNVSWPASIPFEEVSRSLAIQELMELGGNLTGLPLAARNKVTILRNGEQAYPAMLDAIEQAKRSISLATYIFANDEIGQRFVKALGDAVKRGVEVRVLIDSVGSRYGWTSIVPSLQKHGVPVRTFLPSLFPWEFRYANLRNHRKHMVVDGTIAFVGGMNIRHRHVVSQAKFRPIQDVHFRIDGSLVSQIQETFSIDWRFTTGEILSDSIWFAEFDSSTNHGVTGRCIADGPDESLDRIRKILHGAISVARSSILIVTPYFLPDDALVTALSVAALRGVRVDIVLPSKSNLHFVQWASMAQLWQVLVPGCHVWQTPPPFDHSKFFVVDSEWSFVGSANWDPRSLRLNFEMNCELYSKDIAKQLESIGEERKRSAHRVTLDELNSRHILIKIRDGVARLFAPYL
jgi:cardiolipin synthase A/B